MHLACMNVDQIVLLWLPAVFMVLLAGALHLWPPSTINGLYGYRTRRSMSSPEAWNHAQSRSNSLIIEWTGYMVLWTVILSWTGRGEEAVLTASGLMTLGVLLPLIFIEQELKQGPPYPSTRSTHSIAIACTILLLSFVVLWD